MRPVEIEHTDDLDGLREKTRIVIEDIYKKLGNIDSDIYDFVTDAPVPQQINTSIDSDAVDVHEDDYNHSLLHTRSHALNATGDHTSSITENNLMDADANGLPADSGITVDGSQNMSGVGTLKAGDGGSTNYFEVEADGTIKFNGAGTVFDDLQGSISNIRIPTSNAPTERLYNHGIGGGVTFPTLGFAVNDYLYFDVQTYHSMKLNTILDTHIHFMTPTDGSGTPDRFQFQLDVIAAGANGTWGAPTGTPFTKEHTIAADYTNTHKLQDIADIPASNTTVSSLYKFKLTRIAATQDEYGAEVYIEFMDCHYEKDTVGSRTELAK